MNWRQGPALWEIWTDSETSGTTADPWTHRIVNTTLSRGKANSISPYLIVAGECLDLRDFETEGWTRGDSEAKAWTLGDLEVKALTLGDSETGAWTFGNLDTEAWTRDFEVKSGTLVAWTLCDL